MEAEKELQGRRSRTLCLWTVVKTLRVWEDLILVTRWPAAGMNGWPPRLGWLMSLSLKSMARLSGSGRWHILLRSMLSRLVSSRERNGSAALATLRWTGGLKWWCSSLPLTVPSRPLVLLLLMLTLLP